MARQTRYSMDEDGSRLPPSQRRYGGTRRRSSADPAFVSGMPRGLPRGASLEIRKKQARERILPQSTQRSLRFRQRRIRTGGKKDSRFLILTWCPSGPLGREAGWLKYSLVVTLVGCGTQCRTTADRRKQSFQYSLSFFTGMQDDDRRPSLGCDCSWPHRKGLQPWRSMPGCNRFVYPGSD